MKTWSLKSIFTSSNKIHDLDDPVDLRPQEATKDIAIAQDGGFSFQPSSDAQMGGALEADGTSDFFINNTTPEAQMLITVVSAKQQKFQDEYHTLAQRKYENSSSLRRAYVSLHDAVNALARELPCPATKQLKQQLFLVGFRCEVDELAMDMRYHEEGTLSYLRKQKKKISKWAASVAQSLTKASVMQQLDLQLSAFEERRGLSDEWNNFLRMTRVLNEAMHPDAAAIGRSRLSRKVVAVDEGAQADVHAPMRLSQK